MADNDIPNNEKVHAEESPEIGVTNVLTSYRFREQIELDFLEWVGCKHEECVHQSSEFRCFAEEKCSKQCETPERYKEDSHERFQIR